ncbi:MAG: 16S rRNA (uracil(1498)-N(3))-methyltransferase [Thermomicrobiaceae bacterium]
MSSGGGKHRFFVPVDLESAEHVELPERVSHQISRVLRLRPGDAIRLFDGRGNEASARICEIDKRSAVAEVSDGPIPGLRAGPPDIHLGIALIKSDRFDQALQKVTELGVTSITGIETTRSVVSLSADRARSRHERWQRIVIEALEQCERADTVDVNGPVTMQEFVLSAGSGARFIAAERANASALIELLPEDSEQLYLLIGPEGGFTDDEVAFAEQAGFTPVSLGPTILRSETAAIAAVSVVRASLDRKAAPEHIPD